MSTSIGRTIILTLLHVERRELAGNPAGRSRLAPEMERYPGQGYPLLEIWEEYVNETPRFFEVLSLECRIAMV